MSNVVNTIPPRLSAIIEDFRLCEGQEKLDLLLEFAQQLPPLPDHLHAHRDAMDQVHECMTPVFVHAEHSAEGMHFYFDIPAESPTVRGYAALLREGLQGATPTEVLGIPSDFYLEMGLQTVLTPQRLNGISAILAHMKRLAVRELSSR